MIYFTDSEIDQLINEDIPYYDLTSLSVKLGTKVARISYTTRQETLICGTEEVLKIFEKFKINPTLISISGEHIGEGIKFLEGEGLANNIHAIWRTTSNLIEFASGIATRTKQLVDAAKNVSPEISVLTTRKTIPFTKKLTVKAIRIGGGHVHRLGLSDTILIFDNHIKFLGGLNNFISKISEIKLRAAGRSITVEVKNVKDAMQLAKTQIDAIQFDKIPVNDLNKLVNDIKKESPGIKLIAGGNIDLFNIQEYAATGVDIIVSSWPYYGEPIDLNINIEPVFDL
ncbi:MAG: ModD protein [Bacteroidales bacterium]|nr:ModD protein [Bacteroidales bacterium]